MNAVVEQVQLEQVGADFSEEPMLMVRGKTRKIIHEIAARCQPGMVEEDAVEIAKEILAANKMLRAGTTSTSASVRTRPRLSVQTRIPASF